MSSDAHPSKSPFAPENSAARPKQAHEPQRFKLGITMAQVSGGALAAVTSAVAASFFGVGGTIAGAAFGSVVSQVGGAFYQQSLKRAGTRILEAAPTQLLTAALPITVEGPPGKTDAPVEDPNLTQVLEAAPAVEEEPAPAVEPETPLEKVEEDARGINWKLTGLGIAATFVIAIGGITAYEAITQRTISGKGGSGTSITSVIEGKSGTTKTEDPTPTPTSTSSETPTTTATSTATPTDSSTATSTSEPTTTVTVTTTATPTTTSSDASTSTATATSTATTSTNAAQATP